MVYDAIIIGSGGAALSAAIRLKEQNKQVICITKSKATAAQTSQAQGGINGVMDPNDSIESHINDTLRSAHGLVNEHNVRYMCENAKEAIMWLDSIGVPFNRNYDNQIDQRQMGGASFARANYSSDYTGLKILQTLYDKALTLGVVFLEHSMVLSLIKKEDSVIGVSVLDLKTTNINQYLAKNTILASGGYGGVYHKYTTNSVDTTGDGIVLALNVGAKIKNMEMVQFHPTALKDKFILISESARGEGGYLVTSDGKRFVDELLPRDIVARAIYKKIINSEDVYLDLRHLGYEKIKHLMPQEYKLALQYLDIKMDKELVPIIPACHYTMGGVMVDSNCKSSLDNLYAIGEVASIGVHGANRLGGNSLLEIIVFGLKVASVLEFENIIEEKEYNQTLQDKLMIENIFIKDGNSFYEEKNKLGSIMYNNVGLFREKNKLLEAKSFVKNLIDNFDRFAIVDKDKIYNQNLKHLLEFKNLLICADIIIESALLRDESRGAHTRVDFLDASDKVYNIVKQINQEAVKLWI